jgi:Ca2+:H+ antiporter
MVLLVFIPLAAVTERLHWGALAVFSFAALAIVPLAGLMGEATERLAAQRGAGVGGLLNATFGNAAELIIALVALRKGLHDVVKASLTGSIIGNGLLVLGLAVVAGGIGRERQSFDRAAAGIGATLLALAAIGLVVPAMFHFATEAAVGTGAISPARELAAERTLSVEISIVLFTTYLLSLIFSLRTHRHLYAGQEHAAAQEAPFAPAPAWRSVLTLLVATALVAWMSELLVGAVEGASHALGFTEVFAGAVLVAMKNKMDLAINIAIGSSLQIALFVAPILVFASYWVGPRPMDLRFSAFEVLSVLITVGVVHMVSQDGETHWLEGALLLAVYLVLGIAFYFLP